MFLKYKDLHIILIKAESNADHQESKFSFNGEKMVFSRFLVFVDMQLVTFFFTKHEQIIHMQRSSIPAEC